VGFDGSRLTRPTTWPGVDAAPVWSPDGGWIAFTLDRSTLNGDRSSTDSMADGIWGMSPDGTPCSWAARAPGATLEPEAWVSDDELTVSSPRRLHGGRDDAGFGPQD
jgi:WD40-like Beta Propeller Repeat